MIAPDKNPIITIEQLTDKDDSGLLFNTTLSAENPLQDESMDRSRPVDLRQFRAKSGLG